MKNRTKQLIMDAASAAIEVCCERTSYGQYYVEWEDIQEYISKENYDKFYLDIITELWTREEVSDAFATEDNEIDINCYGNWCRNLEECEANDDIWHEPENTLPVKWPKVEEEV